MIMRRAWPLAFLLAAWFTAAIAEGPPPISPAAQQEAAHLNNLPAVVPPSGVHIDHSGRKQSGRASYYSQHFINRKMADGHRMNPGANIAASKSLPLGTTAKVTNLRNGKSATVKIEDRGPYVKGRVVDLSPAVADKLDIKTDGVAPVVVRPITVPQQDRAVKLGAGAAESSQEEIAQATDTTNALTRNQSTDASAR
jgi:rare lipoprotein A